MDRRSLTAAEDAAGTTGKDRTERGKSLSEPTAVRDPEERATRTVDINSDMGESFGAWTMGADSDLLPHITSANVACGFHAGDPRVMAATVEEAVRLHVRVGVHPGFSDLVGFGRRNLALTAQEARTDVLYQIGALHAFCRRAGTTLQHVKPHGQLNNLAMTDRALADAIVAGIADFDPSLLLIAYGGELARAAEAAGLPVAYEAYADRAYNPDGTLLSRRVAGSVFTDPAQIAERALRMVEDGKVTAHDGTVIEVRVDTLCVHGDTPGAPELARQLHAALERSGVRVRSLRPEVRPAS